MSSLLLTRGEQLPQDYTPPRRQVRELSGADLVTVAVQLGEDYSGSGIAGFCVGMISWGVMADPQALMNTYVNAWGLTDPEFDLSVMSFIDDVADGNGIYDPSH